MSSKFDYWSIFCWFDLFFTGESLKFFSFRDIGLEIQWVCVCMYVCIVAHVLVYLLYAVVVVWSLLCLELWKLGFFIYLFINFWIILWEANKWVYGNKLFLFHAFKLFCFTRNTEVIVMMYLSYKVRLLLEMRHLIVNSKYIGAHGCTELEL